MKTLTTIALIAIILCFARKAFSQKHELGISFGAANFLGGKYLIDCTLYVTLEPCVMCAGASYWTQISKIVYGARDEKKGFQNISTAILHPKTELIGGVMEDECRKLMQEFFRGKR